MVFLPLGTVVRLKHADHDLMIVARCVIGQRDGRPAFFDYGGCLWPDGLIEQKLVMFDAGGIDRVLAEGFVNDDETRLNAKISEAVEEARPHESFVIPGDVVNTANTKDMGGAGASGVGRGD